MQSKTKLMPAFFSKDIPLSESFAELNMVLQGTADNPKVQIANKLFDLSFLACSNVIVFIFIEL